MDLEDEGRNMCAQFIQAFEPLVAFMPDQQCNRDLKNGQSMSKN